MSVAALLLGVDAAPADTCRLLEVGCGDGTNLIAMASALPNSHFVGVDLAARHISAGRQMIADLELSNVELINEDIASFDVAPASFDYFIAHGVYSWIPQGLRPVLLRLARKALTTSGIGYISYNTYPGWHSLGAIREMALFSTRNISSPMDRAAKSRELIEFLAQHRNPETPFGMFLGHFAEAVSDQSGVPEEHRLASLIHDQLAEINDPIYFHEFASSAESAGLQFLCEADLRGSSRVGLPDSVALELSKWATSLIEAEQYLDFLRHRTFRRTLLCQKEARIDRSGAATLGAMRLLKIASYAGRIRNHKSGSGRIVKFIGQDGAVFSTDHDVTVAAFYRLRRAYPEAVPFAVLLEQARNDVGAEPSNNAKEDEEILSANLLRAWAYSRSLVELYRAPSEPVKRPGRRPKASRLARYQAGKSSLVTNLRHERVELNAVLRKFIPMLDGSLNSTELTSALEYLSGNERREITEQRGLRAVLRDLAAAGLLV